MEDFQSRKRSGLAISAEVLTKFIASISLLPFYSVLNRNVLAANTNRELSEAWMLAAFNNDLGFAAFVAH